MASAEYLRLYEAVRTNPTSFSAWVDLLRPTEAMDFGTVTTMFTDFLNRFPLCYLYWKKFADLGLKHGGETKAQEIFERGVHYAPSCVDLWVHYCNFAVDAMARHVSSPAFELSPPIEQIFERASQAVGNDFRCGKMYDIYFQWLAAKINFKAIAKLYDRVLPVIHEAHDRYYADYKQFAESHQVTDLVEEEELDRILADLNPPAIDKREDGRIRRTIMEAREAVHNRAADEFQRRQSFELGLSRYFFHPQEPLPEAEIETWRSYLDYEEAESTKRPMDDPYKNQIYALFERCLVPCANIPEFWLRYAVFLENLSVDRARSILQRGMHLQVYPPLTYQLAVIAFEESHGGIDKARASFQALGEHKASHLSVEFLVRYANFEKRHGNTDFGIQLYKDAAILHADQPESRSALAIERARFHRRINDFTSARDILNNELKRDKTCKALFLQALDLEMLLLDLGKPRDEGIKAIERIFKLVASSNLSDYTKKSFVVRRAQILDDYGGPVNELRAAERDAVRLRSFQRKRVHDDMDEHSAKRAPVDPSVAFYNQWAGYGQGGYDAQQQQQQWAGYGQ